MATVTLCKGGACECTVEAASVQIPNVWRIAQRLSEHDRELILTIWQLCHDLREQVRALS